MTDADKIVIVEARKADYSWQGHPVLRGDLLPVAANHPRFDLMCELGFFRVRQDLDFAECCKADPAFADLLELIEMPKGKTVTLIVENVSVQDRLAATRNMGKRLVEQEALTD